MSDRIRRLKDYVIKRDVCLTRGERNPIIVKIRKLFGGEITLNTNHHRMDIINHNIISLQYKALSSPSSGFASTLEVTLGVRDTTLKTAIASYGIHISR